MMEINTQVISLSQFIPVPSDDKSLNFHTLYAFNKYY